MTKPLHNRFTLLFVLLIILIGTFFLQTGLIFSKLGNQNNEVFAAGQIQENPGDGGDVLFIDTEASLASFAARVTNGEVGLNAKLLNNINLAKKVWTPIGLGKVYKGVFDGNGYTISNMIINNSINKEKIGLFSEIGDGAIIKNLQIKDASIVSSGKYIGIVAGSAHQRALITNVAVERGSISYTGNESARLGGIIGRAALVGGMSVEVRNSYSTASLAKSSLAGTGASVYAGGLVGFLDTNGTYKDSILIRNSFFRGTYHDIYMGSGLVQASNVLEYTAKSSYALIESVEGTKISYFYQIMESDGKGNIFSSTLSEAQLKIAGIKLSQFNNSANKNDPIENVDNNWFKENDSAYPVIRGVGNRLIAIKTQNDEYVDLAAVSNSNYKTAAVKAIGSSPSVSFFYSANEDYTWGKLSIYKALSGNTTKQLVEEINNNPYGRLYKNIKSITVSESLETQGYYVVNFELVNRIYEVVTSMLDLKTTVFGSTTGTTGTDVSGTFSVKNVGEGDIYTRIELNDSLNVKIERGNWSEDITFTNSSKVFYIDSRAEFHINAIAANNSFHDLLIKQEYVVTAPQYLSNEYRKTDTIKAIKYRTYLKLIFSDLYEFKYLDNSDLANLTEQQKADKINQVVFEGRKNYERVYNVAQNSVYISYETGDVYTKTSDFSYTLDNTIKFLNTNNSNFYSKGYKLEKWGVKKSESNVFAITNSSRQSIATNSEVLQAIRDVLDSQTEEVDIHDKDIRVAKPTLLYGMWSRVENTATIVSMINLTNAWSEEEISAKMASGELYKNFFYYDESLNSNGNDAKIKATSSDPKEMETNSAFTINVATEGNLKIESDQKGYAIRLRALIIFNGSDYTVVPTTSFGGVNATFASAHSPQGNKWYYDLGEFSSATINDFYGDIVILAVYQRDPSQTNISLSTTKPSGNDVDFELGYKVYEIDGAVVKSGTLSKNNQTIQGVAFLQTIVFNGLNLTTNGYKIDAISEGTKIVVGKNNADFTKIEELKIIYSQDDKNWVIGRNELAIAADKKTGEITQKSYVLYLNIPVVFAGITMEIQAAYLNDQGIPTALPQSDFNPQFSMSAQVPQNGLNPQITGQKAENFSIGTEFNILINKLNLWKPKLNGAYYTVFVEYNNQVKVFPNLKLEASQVGYKLHDFSDFEVGTGTPYRIYIIMQKATYTVNVEISETQKQLGNVYGADGQQIFTSKTIEFEESLSLQAKANTGYKVSVLTLEGKNVTEFTTAVKTVNFEIILSQYFDAGFNLPGILTIKIDFQADNSEYKIEHYQENLDGSYKLVETEFIKSGVKVGQLVTASSKQTGVGQYKYYDLIGLSQQTGVVTPIEEGVLTFVFRYNRKTYQIVYNSNGGTPNEVVEQTKVKFGESFSAKQNTVDNVSMFTRQGYNFVNWNTNSRAQNGISINQNQNVVLNEESGILSYAINTSIVLYAIWSLKTYEVTFIAPEADAASVNWLNVTGYSTSTTEKSARIMVNHNHTFNENNLIKPLREGYSFLGWFTSPTSSIKAEATPIVSPDMKFYAQWQATTRVINYIANLDGASLKFDSKYVYVDGMFGDDDAKGEMVDGVIKTGFPAVTAPAGFVFDGWYLKENPSQAGQKLTNSTLLTAGVGNISVYAHWKVADVVIKVPTNWKSSFTFNGNLNDTLKISTQTSLVDAYIQNASANLSYNFVWKKQVGQTETFVKEEAQVLQSVLKLQNVSQSGFYKVVVKATHAIWGQSNETESELGEVEIKKASVNVSASFENGIISKIYDATTAVAGVESDKPAVLRATAVFADANAGENKTVIFTLTFQAGHLAENYNIYYKNILVPNNSNQTSFTFQDTTAQIRKDTFRVMLGSLQGKMTGLEHTLAANKLTLEKATETKLLVRNQKLDGYVRTNDYTIGVYTAADFTSFLKVVDLNTSVDLTHNYIITLEGTYEIVDGEMKALQISKKGFFDKDAQSSETAFAPAFTILVNNMEYNASNNYEIGGKVLVVSNEPNSDVITILAEPNSDLKVTFIAGTYFVSKAGLQTVAVAKHWLIGGQETLGERFTFDFASIDKNQIQTVEMFYTNFSTINYSSRINGLDVPSQSVYNTQNGITVTHQALTQTGLVFKGWFNSTAENKQAAPTNWKGVGNFNLFADWELENINVDLEKNGTKIDMSGVQGILQISQVYDSQTHSIEAKVTNQSSTGNVTYTYQWLVDEQDVSTAKFYTYKDVTDQNLKIKVVAKLKLNDQDIDQKEFVLQIRLQVTAKQFTFEDVVQKVYDGTKTIKSNDNDFILIDIPTGGQTETLKLVGEYASYEAGESIALVNFKAVNHEDFKASNFQITLPTTGVITKKVVAVVDFGDQFKNNTVYNGSVFTNTTIGDFSADVLNGHEISVTFRTMGSDAGIYSVSSQTLEIVSYDILQSGVSVLKNYDVKSFVGSAQILKAAYNTSGVQFGGTTTVLYDAKEHFIYANEQWPANLNVVYTWKNKLNDIAYPDTIKPVDAGEYEITLDLSFETTNYEVSGNKVFKATLIISKRQVTISIGNRDEYTFGQRTLNINSQDGIFLISNYTLIAGHILTGTVETQGELPGRYSEASLNIIKNFVVKDASNNDITNNYEFKVDGSIRIIHTYTINFNANGGTGQMSNQVVEYGQTVSLSANNFQRYGYTFTGWNSLANGTGTAYAAGQNVSNLGATHGAVINLYAIWSPNANTRFRIEFFKQNLGMLEDGIASADAYEPVGEIKYFEAATENYLIFEPVINNGIIEYYILKTYLNKAAFESGQEEINNEFFNPQREGFTFTAHENQILTGEIVADPVEANWTTFKFYLSRNTYTLTLRKNSADPGQVDENLTYWFEQQIEEPQDPFRTGYVFEGWFINFDVVGQEAKKVNWADFKMPNNDVVLWALYTARQDTLFDIEVYEQVLDKNTVSYSLSRTIPNLQAKTNAEIKIEFVKNAGENKIVINMYENEGANAGTFIKQIDTILYSYEGFYVNEAVGTLTGIANPNEKLVLKIYYLREQYQVTVKAFNGSQDTTTTELYGTPLSRFATPLYIGYVFEDWYLGYDEGSKTFSNKVSNWPYIIKENTTFFAKYAPGTETPFTINIFLQNVNGTYPAVPTQTKTIRSTTDLEGRFSQVTENGQTYFEIKFFKNEDLKFALEKFVFNGFEIDLSHAETHSALVKNDGTGVINAYLKRKQYTITFNIEDSNEIVQQFTTTKVFEANLTYAEAEVFVITKAGYRFAGWFLSEDFASENAVVFPYKVTKDVSFFARWLNELETEYKLEIYLQDAIDDTFPAEANIVQNNVYVADSTIEIVNEAGFDNLVLKLTSKENAVKIIKLDITGYTFNNSLTEMTEAYINIEGTTVVKLYYTINSYNFIVEDGGIELHRESVKFEQTPTYDEILTKQGYNHVGWVIKGVEQEPYVKNAFTMPAKDVTIMPVWQRATNTSYKIVYLIQNLERTGFDEYKVVEDRKTTTLNNLILDGQIIKVYDIDKTTLFADQNFEVETIKGFTLNNSLSADWVVVSADGEAVFTLYFERNEYTITLNFKDKTTPNKVFVNQVYGSLVEWPAPTRLGYTFKGWFFDEAEMINQAVWVPKTGDANTLQYLVDQDRTMFAKWQANTNTPYIVKHYVQNIDDNGYTLYSQTPMTGVTDTEASITILNITGFVFNESASPNTKGNIEPDGSLVLEAYYDRQIYNLIFNGNSNTSGEMQALSFRFGQSKNLPQNEFSKQGFSFMGWTDKDSSVSLKFVDKALYTFNKTEDTTLYALWEINAIQGASLQAQGEITQVQYGNKITLEATYTHLSDHTVSYRWFKDGVEIGMGASTLELTEINQSGSYHVVIFIEALYQAGTVQRHASAQTNAVAVTIEKRQVQFASSNFEFTYNALSQTPTIALVYVEGEGISLPTEAISMPTFTYEIWKQNQKQTESKNVGQYLFKALMQENQNFTLVGQDEWSYEISALEWDLTTQIKQGEFFKHFSVQTLPDPVLEITLKNEITSEDVFVSFTRVSGEKVGFYNLENASTQNTNYIVFIATENQGFEIKKPIDGQAVIEFINPSLLNKIYDGNVVNTSELAAFALSNVRAEHGIELLQAEFELENSSANAGRYKVVLKRALTAEYGEAVIMQNEYYFVIYKKEISYIAGTHQKVYDGDASIQGVNFEGILAKDLPSVTITTVFENENAGINKRINVFVEGVASVNYELAPNALAITGTILKRNVKLVAKDREVAYGTALASINFEFDAFGFNESIADYTLPVSLSQFTGKGNVLGVVTKLNAGLYTISLDNVSVVTNNYEITEIQTATLKVNALEISATSDWTKVYDGTILYNGSITLIGVLANDDVYARAQFKAANVGVQELDIELFGQDKNNYILTTPTAQGEIYEKTITAIFDYGFDALDTDAHSVITVTQIILKYGESILQNSDLPRPTANGYIFSGWFSLPNGQGTLFTLDTIINQDNWDINQDEKTLYAHWTLATLEVQVGLIAYSSTSYEVAFDIADVQEASSGTVTANGQDIKTGNKINVLYKDVLTLVAENTANYVFDGWYLTADTLAVKIETGNNFVVNGNTLQIIVRQNQRIFAKFKLITLGLNINFNAGQNHVNVSGSFARDWEQVSNLGTVTGLFKEFDMGTVVDLPKSNEIERVGYNFAGWFTTPTPSIYDAQYTQIAVTGEMTVYAKWTAKTYNATFVAATGTESDTLLNSDKGHFADLQEQKTLFVQFDTAIGVIETPQRLRYTFVGWFDSLNGGNRIDQNTIFSFTENKTFYARWEEQTYTITINVSSLSNGNVEVVRNASILSVVNSGNTITVSLLANAELKLNIVPKKGYIAHYNFVTPGENTQFIANSNNQPDNLILSISRFKENLELDVKFLAGLLTVQFETTETLKGQLQASAENLLSEDLRQEQIDDSQRVVVSEVNGKQTIVIKVFIGESISISPIAQKGYVFEGFVNIPTSVSVVKNNNIFTFAKFEEDALIQGVFTEQQHTITVKVGKDLTNDLTSNAFGSFASYIIDKHGVRTVVDSNISQSNTSSQIQIKTNEKLVIEIMAKKGFKPAEDTSLYEFVKADQDALNGSFNFENNDTFTFEGFNSDGEITLLFERLLYILNPVVAYEDDNGEIVVVEENSSLYALITIVSTPDDQTQSARFFYENQAEVNVSVQTGYHFVGWMASTNRKQILSTNASSFSMLILDDTNVVALVKQNVYTVEYTQEGKGTFSVEQLKYQVKHGESLPEITVTAARGYMFQIWQIFNFETQTYVVDNANLTPTRQDTNITQNLKIKAVFVPRMVQIRIDAKVFVDIDENGDYIYKQLTSEVGYLQNLETQDAGTSLEINLLTTQTLNILAMPNSGYIISGWSYDAGKFVTIKTTNNNQNAVISEFYEDIVITVIFETKTNKFEIALVTPTGENFTYNVKNAKTLAGFVDIDPTKIIATERYKAYIMAAVRTGNNFEVSFKVNSTYNVLKNQFNQPLIAVKLQGQQLQFITDNVNYVEEEDQILINFSISDFTTDGEVVLFVEAKDYPVLFIKTPQEQQEFPINVENSLTQILPSDYVRPVRAGYTFKGWFTTQKAGSAKYMLINASGQQVGNWDPSIKTIVAEWEKNTVTVNISYSPSINALNGNIDYTDNPEVLKQKTGFVSFEYFVNNDIMFIAPSGKDGYIFSHWEQNGVVVSTSTILTLNIPLVSSVSTFNYTLVYKVRIRVSSGIGGDATINNQAEVYLLPTQTATLLASPQPGYDFVGWSESGSLVVLWTSIEQVINYSPTPKSYIATFIGSKVEVRIQNPDVGGTVKSWLVDGVEPIEENGKQFGRYKQFLSFQIEEQIGFIFDFWTINGINYNTLSTYQISLEDVERGYITVVPNFKFRDVIYRLDFDKVRGTVKVNDTTLSGPQNFKTTYYATINFSFTANDRFQYENLRLITGSTNIAINAEYISVYNNTYTVNMPSNMVSLANNSTIRINFSMLYWLDVREEFEGLGTEDNPYIISNARQFAQMAYLINNNVAVDSSQKVEYASGYYVLTSAIDFKDRFWIPIGTKENPFDGTIKLDYDRNNIYLDREDYEELHYSGLFGYITENAKILVRKVELKTGLIVTIAVTAGLVLVSGAFILISKLKKKKRLARSRVFPTERPTQKRTKRNKKSKL